MIRRALVAVAVAAGVAVAVLTGPAAGPAAAFDLKPGSCDTADAPVPSDPNTGIIQNWRYEKAVPPAEDPFAGNASTTIFEQYGSSQFTFHVTGLDSDESCFLQEPLGEFFASMANLAMGLPEIAWDGVAQVAHYALLPSEWTRYIDPSVIDAAGTAHGAVWEPYFAFLVIVLATYIVIRHARLGAAPAVKALAGVALVAALVGVATTDPLLFARHGDTLITSGTQYAVTAGHFTRNGGHDVANPGEQIAGVGVDRIMYDQWCSGQLGVSSASDIGKVYCPRLFKDQALSYAEASQVEGDPAGAGAALIKAKQDDWKAAADEIKDKYPVNYAFLHGQHAEAVMWATGWVWFGTGVTAPLMLVALIIMFGSFIALRYGSVALQVYGLLALAPRAQHMVWTPLKWMLAAFVNTIGWFVAVLLDISFVAYILRPEVQIPNGIKMLICAVFTVLMWFALKPLRRFTSSPLISGGGAYDPASETGGALRSSKRRVVNWAAGYTATRAGASAGVHAAMDDEEQQKPEPVDPDRYSGDLVVADPGWRTRERVTADQVPDTPAPTPAPAPEPLPAAEEPLPAPVEQPAVEAAEPDPVRPQTIDGEDVYVIYDPETKTYVNPGDSSDDVARTGAAEEQP